MTKVALINPGKNFQLGITEPLNLGFIASYLEKHNIEVKIIDQIAGEDVCEEINKYQPDVVGVTATTVVVNEAYKIADYCRQKNILTVMGGVHSSVLPEEALNHCDIIVKGEGELAMLDIIKNGITKGVISRHYIKNLDEVPPPAWHLMNMEFYLNTRRRIPYTHLDIFPIRAKIASIMTQRGCPYRCIFCCNSWRDTPVRFNSPEWIINALKYLMEKFRVNALYFADDDFFVNKSRLKKICNLIKQSKINILWSCQARADSIDEETLKMAKNTGCQQIQFGFESGSQRILDILKKKTVTVKQNADAIKLCKKIGISSFATFIIGNPTETTQDLEMTYQFIKNNKPDGGGGLITTPFPGTELWQWCKRRNLIPEKVDYNKFTTGSGSISSSDTLTEQELLEWRDKICNLFDNLTLKQILWEIYNNPLIFLKIIKNPVKTIKIAIRRKLFDLRIL